MTTNATAVFSIRPRSASWQDRREYVGVEAAVEAIVEIMLTGEAVELMERTSEGNTSYRNARIRKIEREAAHRLAARDAGTPAETGYTAETGRVAVRGVVVGYVYRIKHARKASEYVFVTADGTEVELGAVEGKLGQSWANAVGEAAVAAAEEVAAQEVMGTDEDAPAVRAAQIEDGEVEAPAAPAEDEAAARLADAVAADTEIVPVPVEGREIDLGGRVFLNGHEFGIVTAYLAADGVPYLWDARTLADGAIGRAYGTRREAVVFLLSADRARLEAALEAPADGEALRAAYADKERREADLARRRIVARAREAAERVEDGLLDYAEELLWAALEELRASRARETARLTA